jgi:Domain of unknown function (DUF4124)
MVGSRHNNKARRTFASSARHGGQAVPALLQESLGEVVVGGVDVGWGVSDSFALFSRFFLLSQRSPLLHCFHNLCHHAGNTILKEPTMTKPFVQMLGCATSLLLLPAFSSAQGTLYKWTDSRGNLHYSNTPTNTTATAVDDTLPPASSFKSPTPPEPAKDSPPSSESNPTPDEEGGGAPGEAIGASPTPAAPTEGSQLPLTGETAEGEPAPVLTDESATGAQQQAGENPPLTPEQEQALKDSPM